jgi:hypothetical protein
LSHSFTVHIEIDHYNDPEGDKERERAIRTNSLPVPMGGFWRYSISKISTDGGTKTINTQSVLEIESKTLKELIKDLFNRLPRFLDENGVRSN